MKSKGIEWAVEEGVINTSCEHMTIKDTYLCSLSYSLIIWETGIPVPLPWCLYSTHSGFPHPKHGLTSGPLHMLCHLKCFSSASPCPVKGSMTSHSGRHWGKLSGILWFMSTNPLHNVIPRDWGHVHWAILNVPQRWTLTTSSPLTSMSPCHFMGKEFFLRIS